MYGPVEWTPQGPVLASQSVSTLQSQPQMTKEQEIQYLEQEIKALEEEKKTLEQEMETIRKRLEELKK
jgi:molecular chaperone GrpE (heat shock protein)